MILDDIAGCHSHTGGAEKEKCPLNEIKKLAYDSPDTDYSFYKALKRDGISLICEVKKLRLQKEL